MSRAVIFSIILAGLIVIGTTPVWAAQFDTRIDPNEGSSPFKVSYLKTIFIEYPNGGNLSDELRGKQWTVSGTADISNPGVKDLLAKLNQKIISDGSQARISDLNVNYNFYLKARNISTSIDYKVLLEGTITNYVITKDTQRTLVDLGWRGLSVNDEIIIDGVDINIPLNILKTEEPEVYTYFVGTEAEDVFNRPLINADFILEQPMTNWHFLFDPTGITSDAKTFGLDESISGFVISSWTMGESSIREGIQIEKIYEVEIMSDEKYIIRSVQSSDQGNISAIGFGALDTLEGLEIIGVTPKPPEGYSTTSTGGFPAMIMYGMAGMAAVGTIVFFISSKRKLKNLKSEQTGIAPSQLVGYETSKSSGGYHTNRGEAQLKDDTDYQKTRNVYDETQQQSPPPQAASSTNIDQACGCEADSGDPEYACDCAMQGHCICSADCKCTTDVCKEAVGQLS
ncbi:MAG: hypothetical protein QQN41_05645 [Nitrosopumilus sp.]